MNISSPRMNIFIPQDEYIHTQCRIYIEAKELVLGGPGLKGPPN